MRDYYSRKIQAQFRLRADSFEHSASWITDKNLLDIHWKLAHPLKNNLILDLCCGTGIVGQRLLYDGSKVVGIDISISMLKKARGKDIFCINAKGEELPFWNDIFDIVVCRQAFHFLNTTRVIKEMYRVTKPGGKIILSQIVPFGEEDSDWLYQIHRKKQPLLKNFLIEEDLKSLLETSGCVNIVSYEHVVEESINHWLFDPSISKEAADEVKKVFLNAPLKYKALHKTKIVDGEIFDNMRWVVIRGRKNQSKNNE